MGSPRQESWNGLPYPSPGDLPDPGIEPGSPALQADSLPSEPLRRPLMYKFIQQPMNSSYSTGLRPDLSSPPTVLSTSVIETTLPRAHAHTHTACTRAHTHTACTCMCSHTHTHTPNERCWLSDPDACHPRAALTSTNQSISRDYQTGWTRHYQMIKSKHVRRLPSAPQTVHSPEHSSSVRRLWLLPSDSSLRLPVPPPVRCQPWPCPVLHPRSPWLCPAPPKVPPSPSSLSQGHPPPNTPGSPQNTCLAIPSSSGPPQPPELM